MFPKFKKKSLQIKNMKSFLERKSFPKRSFWSKKKAEEALGPKLPKITIYQEHALTGWGKKDLFFITLVTGLGIYSIYSTFTQHTEENLEKIKNELNSDDPEVLKKTLEDFMNKTMSGSDHGVLYLKYGIMDRVMQLLSHSDIEVKKNAVRIDSFFFY